MNLTARKIYYYERDDGRCPFTEWRDSLKDQVFLDAWQKRLLRIRLGLLGKCSSVGEGVLEFKFDIGPGYRIYFAEWGRSIVVILLGGDKSTQAKDVEQAKRSWKEFRSANS